MKILKGSKNQGFSLIELIVAMTITLVLLGIASGLFSKALGVRARESQRTDALTSAQAALNVMSREIGNSGYGLFVSGGSIHVNGIVTADSGKTRIRVRSNFQNSNITANDAGEDIMYYWDSATESIVRHDLNTQSVSYIINRVSSVEFLYWNYTDLNTYDNSPSDTPTPNTARVTLTVIVKAEDVQGVDSPPVKLTSDVTIRNSQYMMRYY